MGNRYSFGKPKPTAPITTAGNWDHELCVLSMQTRLKIVVRPPHGVAGEDTDADFEPALRKAVAGQLLALESEGFIVVGAVVEQFEDAGG